MAHKLWEKNFEVNKEIERFTVGRDRELDLYLAKYDVLGSMAHITMLESIGLLEKDELTQLLAELKNIYAIADKGEFVIEDGVEDVHSQVELMLTQKLGDMGKKIHSGRSRNDQVLVDLKLFTRHELKEIVDAVKILFDELIQKSNQYKDVLMPGYTHLQVAMPSSFGLWFGASTFYPLDFCMSGIPACGYCVQFAFQFSITAYPVFRQEIHGLGGLFQIVQLRPMGEARALLCLDVVLDINEQADLSVTLLRLLRWSGASGDPGGKGFFGIIYAKGFQTGEPFLIRCFGGDILAALDLITFPLQAAKQFF